MATNTNKYHYQFVHNVFGNFIHDTHDYFKEYLYPRFNYSVVGTYDKAVEYLRQQDELGREMDKQNLPAFILNPVGELNVAEGNTGARQLWRFPNLAPGLVFRLFNPIYQDSHVQVTPGFTRLKGEIELIMLLNSFYEYCDLRVLLIQIFGGIGDRFIHPVYFNSFIILEDELYNYTYENDVTGVSYKLDWDGAGATDRLVESTNINEKVYPCKIKPVFKMTAMGDGSTKYGGTDKLADWRLTATIEYEVEIPTFLLIQTDYLVNTIKLNMKYGSCYTSYSSYNIENPPVYQDIAKFYSEFGLDSTSSSEIEFPDENIKISDRTIEYKVRYYHVVTQAEADSSTTFDITIPETIDDNELLIVNSKSGVLDYGSHFTIEDNGNTLRIYKEYVPLEVNDILELYVYKEM